MKRTTIYLTPEVHEKLIKLADKKKMVGNKDSRIYFVKSCKR